MQGDAHLGGIQLLHRPVARQRFGQLFAIADEAQGATCRAADADAFLPVSGVDIEVLLLDASHQGRGEDLLGEAAIDFGQAQPCTVFTLVGSVDHAHQFHHHRQAGEGFLTCAEVHRLDHRPAETVMKRAASGCVITTKTNDHG
ncbi:hypothetical protein D9M68_776000 [compost metagenome]